MVGWCSMGTWLMTHVWQLQLPRLFKKQDNQLRWSPPEREIFQQLPCRFSGNQNGNIYPSRLADHLTMAILDCQGVFTTFILGWIIEMLLVKKNCFWSFLIINNIYIPGIKRLFFHQQQQNLWLAELSFGAPPSPQLLARCPWLWQIANWDMAPTTSWSPTSRMGHGGRGSRRWRKPPMGFWYGTLGWSNMVQWNISILFVDVPIDTSISGISQSCLVTPEGTWIFQSLQKITCLFQTWCIS